MGYPHSLSQTVADFAEANIEKRYHNGFVFTRLGKGIMHQINSLRIDLSEFELSSENRRVLNKTDQLDLKFNHLSDFKYTWHIGKMAKDFYTDKFGPKVMTANKVKELATDLDKSNMNSIIIYRALRNFSAEKNISSASEAVGYCLCFATKTIVHYAYPFYDLNVALPNLGMGMMLKAMLWAQDNDKKYIYLGSDQKYKRQFKGLELFNAKEKTWYKV